MKLLCFFTVILGLCLLFTGVSVGQNLPVRDAVTFHSPGRDSTTGIALSGNKLFAIINQKKLAAILPGGVIDWTLNIVPKSSASATSAPYVLPMIIDGMGVITVPEIRRNMAAGIGALTSIAPVPNSPDVLVSGHVTGSVAFAGKTIQSYWDSLASGFWLRISPAGIVTEGFILASAQPAAAVYFLQVTARPDGYPVLAGIVHRTIRVWKASGLSFFPFINTSGAPRMIEPTGVAIHPATGAVAVTCRYDGTVDFPVKGGLERVTSQGEDGALWLIEPTILAGQIIKILSGPDTDRLRALVFSNGWIVGGDCGQNATFGGFQVSSSGSRNAVIAKFLTDGSDRWIDVVTAASQEASISDLALDASGRVWIAGHQKTAQHSDIFFYAYSAVFGGRLVSDDITKPDDQLLPRISYQHGELGAGFSYSGDLFFGGQLFQGDSADVLTCRIRVEGTTAVADALEEPPTTASLDAWPNPGTQMIRFKSSPSPLGQEVRVFDLTGRLVAVVVSIAGITTWQLTDQVGRPVPNGIYIARSASGSKKVVVMR